MQNEIVIIVSGVPTYLYPSNVKPNHAGFGTKSRSLSGKPFLVVRGKRLDSVSISFDSVKTDTYEYLRYLWENDIVFELRSAIPSISESNCTIDLDGFNMEASIMDSYSGTIEVTVL